MSAALALRGVSVTLGEQRIVDDVSFEVAAGEWMGLIGPNGAGKSTLLRAVAGLAPCVGTVEINGRASSGMSGRERGQILALVPQNAVIPEGMTVTDYVHLGRTPHLGLLQRAGRQDVAVVRQALRRLDLTRFSERSLTTLSGGELQRVLLARALAQEPRIVLLDEPTSALDIGHQQEVLEVLDEIRRSEGVTVLATMHDLTLAGSYCDRLVLLHRGRAVRAGSAEHVLDPVVLRTTYGAGLAVHGGGPGHGPVVVPVRH